MPKMVSSRSCSFQQKFNFVREINVGKTVLKALNWRNCVTSTSRIYLLGGSIQYYPSNHFFLCGFKMISYCIKRVKACLVLLCYEEERVDITVVFRLGSHIQNSCLVKSEIQARAVIVTYHCAATCRLWGSECGRKHSALCNFSFVNILLSKLIRHPKNLSGA
jgi:hypothetical protein